MPPARSLAFTTRVLVVDDSPAICEDIRKILAPRSGNAALDALEAELFRDAGPPRDAIGACDRFEVDAVHQGEVGVERVVAARASSRPYALAFVDVRIPPGQNGVVTMERMLRHDPEVAVVLCTAYADFSWSEMLRHCPARDRLLILKKPFDAIEVAQLAHALSRRWRLARATSLAYELARAIRAGARPDAHGVGRAVATPDEWGTVLAEVADRAATVHARATGVPAATAMRAIGAAFGAAMGGRAPVGAG